MQLVTTTEPHIQELMQWLPDQPSCAVWAGPHFRYPFTAVTFREDLRLHYPTYSLLGATNELLGFGQYYLRVGRCHLAMLIISPQQRGRATGAVLIRELCRRGCSELSVNECSLFVMSANLPAVRLYTRLGFRLTPYPEPMPPVQDMVYMVTLANAILD